MAGAKQDAAAIHQAAVAAHAAGALGDFRPAAQWLAEFVDEKSDEATAWVHALHAQRWHAEPAEGALPSIEGVARLRDASSAARIAGATACSHGARACILNFDASGLRAWSELQASLLPDDAPLEARLDAELNRCWVAITTRDAEAVLSECEKLARSAADQKLAVLRIESTATHAHALAMVGRIDDAVSAARSATRMGRTEHVPQSEYLANVVLSRLRRLSGRPHLAQRILNALLRVAPQNWYNWIDWELVVSGDLGTERPAAPAGSAGALLRETLAAARQGNRSDFDRAVSEAAGKLRDWHPQVRDFEFLRVAIDAKQEPQDAELSGWSGGDTATPPVELRGIGMDTDTPSDDSTSTYVYAGGDGAARRVLRLGLAMLDTTPVMNPVRGHPGRVESLLSALALAGSDGLQTADVFRAVYGFAFDADVHRGLFDVLLHRARATIEEFGEITRPREDTLALQLQKSILIPDPRCERPLEDLVLAALARRGTGSAKAAAEQLGIPLRTTQSALKRLTSEGILIVEKEGRRVVYRVEDSVFSEPTQYK